MALGVLATITVQEGKNQEFETIFKALIEKVLANEEGVLLYALHRSKSNPQEYVVMEQYRTAADIEAHSKAGYFLEAQKAMGKLVAGAPVLQVLDVV